MAITVREKEHWKERIHRKIDQAIDEACATRNPSLLATIQRKSKERALESLEIAVLRQEIDRLNEAKKDLDRNHDDVVRRLLAVLRGVDEHEVSGGVYGWQREVDRAVTKRAAVIERELLAQDPLGREILRLRREKEELLDTVWLATSPKQIKQLWNRVSEALGQEPTPLQRETLLNIEPLEAPNK